MSLSSPPRVAIVEDELMVAWSLQATVEDLGYQVAGIFADADAALAQLLLQPVDLVLMDINLGRGMDGVETARRVKAAFRTPIVFISAYADPAMRERIAKAVPGAPLLSKPVETSLLTAAIEDGLASAS
jgi:CheY-like chemotaxis protein